MTRASELRNTDDATLERQIDESKQEMFNLRFRLATGNSVNTARIKQLRREIARMQTILRERQEG
ncbi:MAG: 50S ribosomal protein L29 [Chloroflexota bacterium]|nr:50S ribosomal protein L29 [Chloroflexota bacterium]